MGIVGRVELCESLELTSLSKLGFFRKYLREIGVSIDQQIALPRLNLLILDVLSYVFTHRDLVAIV